MLDKLNFEELFTIARSIEKDGYDFYTEASVKTKDPQLSKSFKNLASWESEHINMINAIEAECAKARATEFRGPMSEITGYIEAVVKGNVFDLNKLAEKQVKSISTEKELLCYACELEKKSILFYTGLRLSLPQAVGAAVDKLIEEETRHLTLLNKKILNLT